MQRLKKLRCEYGYNQCQLAEILSISQASISLFEKGLRFPDAEIIAQMSRLFDVSSDYLLELSDVRRPLSHSAISVEEAHVLELYRNLDEYLEQKAVQYAQNLLHAHTQRQSL